MRLAALCPTYGRPRLIRNVLAMWNQQTLPWQDRMLIILDDGAQLPRGFGHDWCIYTTPTRYPSMSSKYARLLEIADDWGVDGYVVWDDDDVYLPWHMEAHAHALASHAWSYPTEVWSEGGGSLARERTGGNLHGSIAIGAALMQQLGGWPDTKRADFDLQMIGRLSAAAQPGRPDADYPPSYVFRWANTGHRHYQNYCTQGHTDETVYDRVQRSSTERLSTITPAMDAHTTWLWQHLLPTLRPALPH